MKTLIAAVAVLTLATAPAALAEHPVDGQWEGEAETPRGIQEIAFDFTEADGVLTGTITTRRGESDIEDGTVMGNEISFKQTLSFQGREFVLAYTGELDGDEITFTREVEGRDRSQEFTATRVK